MSNKRILYIEDELEMVELMKIRLQSSGYEVISACDGQEGLDKVYQEKPDLILLDVIIPKIDGITLTSRLKSDPQTRHIPIIIISASGEKDLPERCKAAGTDELVIKPFEPEELLAKIKVLLEKQRKEE